MVETIVIIISILVIVAVCVYQWVKVDNTEETQNTGEIDNKETDNNEFEQKVRNTESKPSDYVPKKPSGIVIVISGVMLTISIIASIVCFVACSYQHDDTLQIVLGIIGGYNLLQGMIFFALMYGVGHILKNSEEMNEKMDELIEK